MTALKALASTWRGRFILAFLAVQLLLPLHYYLVRKDIHDERFAWRMFSPMRMSKCETTFSIDDKPVNPYAEFHEAWVELSERGRASVIEAMAHRLCAEHPGKPVIVKVSCTYLGRAPATYGGFDLCTRPLF